MGELLHDEDEAIFDNVKCKFFASNHGKSPCDSHFGKISYYYQLYTSTQQKGIHTTQDLCDMIQQMMTQRHEARMAIQSNAKKKPKNYAKEKLLKFYAINFDIDNVPILKEAHLDQVQLQYKISIPDVKSFGYFESDRDDDMIEQYEKFKCDPNTIFDINYIIVSAID